MSTTGSPQLEAGDTNSIDSKSHQPANTSTAATIADATRGLSDPDIVDWDGPDDPANPLNWRSSKKITHVLIVSLLVLTANLAATMFAPGAPKLADEFHITNSIVETMAVSIYILGFALGPLAFAPVSEIYGRLPIYHVCNVLYLAFTAGCAFSTNTAMFLVFRFICGCVASGPMSTGGGTIADITPQQERGKAMALFMMGPLLGPVFGPIIGGFISQYTGWRWTFRIIMILVGILGVAAVLFMRETYAPVLLQRKAERMRKETGNPNLAAKTTATGTPQQLLLRAMVRPMKLLIFSPIVLLVSLYTGVTFGLIFLLFTTFPSVFHDVYGFDAGIAGLAYLGLGIGMFLGLILFSALSDRLLGKKMEGSVADPEQRLILMQWFSPVAPLGCFIYGWCADYHTHWIAPILGTFVIGLGALFVVLPGQSYLVDAYGAQAAASSIAANLLVRCLFGAFLGLAAPPLYAKLGLGWGNSVLGFITLAFAPVPWLFYRYGRALRTRFSVDL